MTERVDEIVAELLRSVAELAPSGRAVVWQVTSSPDALFYGSGSHAGALPSPAVLFELDGLLRGPDDGGPLVLEVTVDAGGTPRFGHSAALAGISPPSVVLDPGYRYPGHPLPGMPRPPGFEPDDRPTDPAVLRRVEGSLAEFTEQYRRLKGRDPVFGVRETEERIVAAERRMGLRLPEDVRALYLLAGDDTAEIGVLGRYGLFPLDAVVESYLESEPGAWGWRDGLFDLGRVVLDTDPAGTVRRISRSDWWVVVGSDFGGNFCAVDLDPAPGGTAGQMIEYGRDFHGPVGYAGESVTARLAAVVAAAVADQVDPDIGRDRARLGVNLPDGSPRYGEAIQRIGARTVAEVLPAEAGHVQQLYLNHADALDLRALSATPNLRELSINRAASVRLWLPERVEALSLDTANADLSELDGHPALWDLTVSGLSVRVRDLTGLPRLTRLDVSAAEVDDLAALADLDLRVLILNTEQWQVLRAANRIPARLAGAQWIGSASLAEATEWATWLHLRLGTTT